MTLNTDHLDQCINSLEALTGLLAEQKQDTIQYAALRSAIIKEFELTIEVAGKTVRKALKEMDTPPQTIDRLSFKETFRLGAKHSFLDPSAIMRWFEYRGNRNETAHDYGVDFAEKTLKVIPSFIEDAKLLSQAINLYFTENP